MNIAAYCRVSTDKSDQLNSLETQKKLFAEKNGHNMVRLYADEGISGTKIKNRREFLRLMQDARQRQFEMVVVKDISRFARNTVDFLQSIRTLKELDIETVFLTSNQKVLGRICAYHFCGACAGGVRKHLQACKIRQAGQCAKGTCSKHRFRL